MLILTMLLAGQSVSAMATVLPTCHANQLRLSLTFEQAPLHVMEGMAAD